MHLRLSQVFIENKSYAKSIERYDKPHTLFYLDPPYYGYENFYGDGIFSREDFVRMRDLLKNIKGKFIMSINDHPEIRHIYKGYNIETIGTSYSVAGADKKKKVNELLVMNY